MFASVLSRHGTEEVHPPFLRIQKLSYLLSPKEKEELKSFIPSTASRSSNPAQIQAWGDLKSISRTSLGSLTAAPSASEEPKLTFLLPKASLDNQNGPLYKGP